MFDDATAAWAAAVEGMTDYWVGAIARAATPPELAADALRWAQTVQRRERPSWSSPNEIVFETGVARLRDFSQGSRAQVVPTLVLPPQAGHDSCIADYSRTQSQMGVIRGAGLEKAYALDWKGATAETRDAGIDDYLAVMDRAVEELGGRVNLVGDCQGGWLATIWAALHPEAAHTLTIAGAPIDFHAGEAAIHRWVNVCAPSGNLAFYEALVAGGGGVLKGEHMLNGFITMGPQNEIARQLQLLANIHDAEHVERYREFEDWFKHTQDIPGRLYLWIVARLFRDNALVRGELEIGGERAELSRITCPLYLLAGSKDHITPPPQVFALARHAHTPAEQVTLRTARGGHLGLFMGSEALREHWAPLMAEVAQLARRGRRRPVNAS